MKWKQKNGKTVETNNIVDIDYLHNLINYLGKHFVVDDDNENDIGFNGGFFYKD